MNEYEVRWKSKIRLGSPNLEGVEKIYAWDAEEAIIKLKKLVNANYKLSWDYIQVDWPEMVSICY